MKPGPKPFVSKICPVCGIDKPRAEYYKKLSAMSHKCKPCTLKDHSKRAPKYFGKYSAYVNAWRRGKYKTDPIYREKCSFSTQMYRADVKRATPKWVDRKALTKIYSDKPRGMEVDHIIPLRGLIDGRSVCGLHVPWNLQYLSTEENGRKHNKVSEKDIMKNQR